MLLLMTDYRGETSCVYNFSQNNNVLVHFDCKASQPTILQQSVSAFEGDMGITSPYLPDKNTMGQIQYIPAHSLEISAVH